MLACAAVKQQQPFALLDQVQPAAPDESLALSVCGRGQEIQAQRRRVLEVLRKGGETSREGVLLFAQISRELAGRARLPPEPKANGRPGSGAADQAHGKCAQKVPPYGRWQRLDHPFDRHGDRAMRWKENDGEAPPSRPSRSVAGQGCKK